MFLRKAASMARLDTMSNALTPSMESTVASGLTWATHSVPARLLSAYWNETVKRSTVRPTKRLMTSPATMPQTPPSYFWSAVILLMRTASTSTSGASHPTNCSPCSEEPVQIGGSGQQGSEMFRSHSRPTWCSTPV